MESDSVKKSVAIVVPVYNEEVVLPELFKRINGVVSTGKADFTVIYVDDGSKDRTSEILQEEAQKKSYVQVIQLSRNFGQQPALKAGLDHASTDAVVFIDADLQDPPEVVLNMIDVWRKGADVVVGKRKSRAEKGFRRLCFSVFHRIYAILTGKLIPPNSGIFGLIDRRVADVLRSLPEANLYLQGLRGWVGFRQELVYYDRPDRAAGETKMSFLRLIQYAWNAVAGFSFVPMRLILLLGGIVTFIGFLCGLSLLLVFAAHYFNHWIYLEISGFMVLAVAIFFFGGIQLMSIGLVGEYVARVYDESKRRPLYLIRKKLP